MANTFYGVFGFLPYLNGFSFQFTWILDLYGTNFNKYNEFHLHNF